MIIKIPHPTAERSQRTGGRRAFFSVRRGFFISRLDYFTIGQYRIKEHFYFTIGEPKACHDFTIKLSDCQIVRLSNLSGVFQYNFTRTFVREGGNNR